MAVFTKSQMNEIKEYLFHSSTHDSLLKNVHYDEDLNFIRLDFENLRDQVCYHFSFHDIKALQLIKCFDYSYYIGSKTVIAFEIEENDACFQNLVIDDKEASECLLFVIEMLSGDTLHIAGKSVDVVSESVTGVSQGRFS